MKACSETNTCPVCGTQEPCEAVHLVGVFATKERRHRNTYCLACALWIMQRRDTIMKATGCGPRLAERQAKDELRVAQRELDAPDFRSYRDVTGRGR